MVKKLYIEIVDQEAHIDAIVERLTLRLQQNPTAQNPAPEPLLTTEEMYTHLNICRSKFLGLLYQGIVPGIRIGNQWRFNRKEVEEAFRSNSINYYKTK